jgi:hypothetical protein
MTMTTLPNVPENERVQHHSFNSEGRCAFCDIRWVHAVGTVCDNERVKETNEPREEQG